MKFIIVCFLLTVPVTFGLSGLLEMSQALWSKLLNGGLANIEPLDPLHVPIVKVDQAQGRTNYRMILTNIEILGLNNSSLESIHVARGSVKSNLSEHEAGYVTYNDRNAIDFIRYRFHTVVKEPNNKENDHEDLRVDSIEKYEDAVGTGRDDRRDLKTRRGESNKYQENQQRYTNNDEYNNRHYANMHQQEKDNQYQQHTQQQHYPNQQHQNQYPNQQNHNQQPDQQHRGQQHQTQHPNQQNHNQQPDQQHRGQQHQTQHPNQQHHNQHRDQQHQNQYPNHQDQNQQHQNQHPNQQHQNQYPNHHDQNQQHQNQHPNQQNHNQQPDQQYQNQYPKHQDQNQRHQNQYPNQQHYDQQRGQQHHSQQHQTQYSNRQHQNQHQQNQHGHQDDFVPHRGSTASQENIQRQHAQTSYNENNYQKHQQIPQIEGFKATPTSYSTQRNSFKNDNNNGNYGGGSRYLVYAQTQQKSKNVGDQKNNYQNGPRINENYEEMPSKHSIEIPRDLEVQQINGKIQIKYPARLSSDSKPCADAKDIEDIEVIESEKRLGMNAKYRGSSERLEDQPGYVDIMYADENSKKMRHFGNLRMQPRGDRIVYSLEDILKDLENHRRFIVHNFTESELLSKRNDKLRTAEETKRIKDMIRYAKEFQEDQGFFEEGMELIYHYGNGSETKVYDGKRMKRAHEQENENEDDIMHVIIKVRVPLLRIKADYVLMGKVGDQVLRGNGQLIGNFTELIGDFTVELKKSANKTMTVRAARAKLEAANQNIKLQGLDENGAVAEILTQGLMAAEAVAAMLADDLATKALNDSNADTMIYKMYKELPTN